MRRITVADYFVEVLIENGVTEVFGYQGGMIAYIFDSLGKYKDRINYHSCGSEQGAAIAACSYAQASGKFGVAISTSGPGFTNMLTGMANAWLDSIPVVFISGNVNTKDKKRNASFRQLGFQEIQAADIAKNITKKSVEIELDTDIKACLDDVIRTAISDRKGPVYIDLPINVCREYVDVDQVTPVKNSKAICMEEGIVSCIEKFLSYNKPVIIAGAGINQAGCREKFRILVEKLGIPVVTTMPGIDLLPSNSAYMMGYIGGTARREAGIVLQNAESVLTLGTRLCSKQIGHNMALFAPNSEYFVRVDLDDAEFERKPKEDEVEIHADVEDVITSILSYFEEYSQQEEHEIWLSACNSVYDLLQEYDMTEGNQFFKDITSVLDEDASIIIDVGKNMTYGTQSSIIKSQTRMFMSAGLGTMGYAIPAAIGVACVKKKPVYVFTGDGGAQMNIQELNTIAKSKLPVKIFVLNNRALGNIRLFQESYLDSRFVATGEREGDYYSCNFANIAQAYDMKGIVIHNAEEAVADMDLLTNEEPILFEFIYSDCPALPGIVAGGDFLKEGTGIDVEVIDKIKKLMK